MTVRDFLVAATAVTFLPFAAFALNPVAEAGGWGIYRDASMGGGCYMMAPFENGTVVQLGYDATEEITFLTLFSQDWTGLTADETYTVGFDLDGTAWEADGFAVNDGELGGILVQIENEDFIVDLAEKSSLSMSYQGEEVVALDLSGSRDAVVATVECMAG